MSEKKREYYIRRIENALKSDDMSICHEVFFTEDAIRDILELLKAEPKCKKGKWIAYGDIPKTCPYCHEDWDKYVYGDVWYSGELPNFCPNCGERIVTE